MRELKTTRDIVDLTKEAEEKGLQAAFVVTTNGMTKSNGCAVMGAGIAKYVRDNFPETDFHLGQSLRKYGNHAVWLGRYYKKNTQYALNIITMPTKNDWRNDSDLSLIEQSAKEIMTIAETQKLDTIYMPRPGCSNGHLDWETQVKPTIERILDDRFIVISK